MIWLACAESLKRRFREAQLRDKAAGKIVGEIEAKEREHKAVDKFVLTKAHEYGFVSDSGHTILNHIYEMRCIYGHPYEEAPSQEQVTHAAAVVVEHVLSKPVKLRHGFGKQLLKSLLEERSFLDEQQTAVEAFTKDILPRIDESIHGWLLDYYWAELEKISGDATLLVFFRRGIWFSRTLLLEVGINVFSYDDWHDKTCKFPKVLMRVCGIADVFKEIGERAQDSLVGVILAESGTIPNVLVYIERLNSGGVLTKRQQERFVEHVSKMEIGAICSAGLSTMTCYGKLINAMKSKNWYVQNPAIDLIISNGPEQVGELDSGQQENIGRNILQAGEGGAGSANLFLEKLSNDGNIWSYDLIRGIFHEAFVNEKSEIRFKKKHLSKILATLDSLKATKRRRLVTELIKVIDAGTPKPNCLEHEGIQKVVDLLKNFPWTENFIKCLEKKREALKVEEVDV